MTGSLKLLLVSAVAGLLMLATAVPAFAAPPADAANRGLFTAVTNVMMNGLATEGHPANFGTHNAVCTVTARNPATNLVDLTC